MVIRLNQKQPSDVLGFRSSCVNFIQCPICYGCRNYRDEDPDCANCTIHKKRDICDTKKHRADLISKMVLRPRIKIPNIEFKSK